MAGECERKSEYDPREILYSLQHYADDDPRWWGRDEKRARTSLTSLRLASLVRGKQVFQAYGSCRSKISKNQTGWMTSRLLSCGIGGRSIVKETSKHIMQFMSISIESMQQAQIRGRSATTSSVEDGGTACATMPFNT